MVAVVDMQLTYKLQPAVCIPRLSRSVCQCPRAESRDVRFAPGMTCIAAVIQPFHVAHKRPSESSLQTYCVEVEGTSARSQVRGVVADEDNACGPYWLGSRCMMTVMSAAQLLRELSQV